MVDRERALNLLMGRYRYEEAMRLFGEYCLLLEEDWNDFVARHSPVRLRQLHKQLAAVGLWPAEIQAPVRGTGLLSAVTGLLSGIKMPPEEAPEPPPAPTRGPDTAAQAAAGRDPEQVLQSLVAPALGLELHPALYHHAEVAAEAGPLQDAIGLLRYRLAQELGFVLPLVHMHENVEMSEHTYAIRIAGETIAEGRLQPDRLAALGQPLPESWKPEPHPVRPCQVAWLPPAGEGKAVGWSGETQPAHALLTEHLEEVVRRNAHRLFTNQSLDLLLRAYEPEIGKDTYAELFGRFMSLTELRLVLQALLKAGYGVRSLPRIVDILMAHFINFLAEKPLSMDETWKISSHLPFFSTENLTEVVCKGLGLPPISDRRSSLAAALERVVRQSPDGDRATGGLDGPSPWDPGKGAM